MYIYTPVYAYIYTCMCMYTQTLSNLFLSYECLLFCMSSHILNFIPIDRSSMQNNLARELRGQFKSLKTELCLLLSRHAFL